MRLTSQSSYAIRALIYCAVNGDGLSHVAAIAKAHAISELFLFKLIRPLVDGGLLETVRGRKGGIRLARPAGQISLLDVVRLTEDSFAMAECFESGNDIHCPLAGACDLNAALHEALNAFFEVLDSYSIADLAKKRQSLRRRLGLEELLPLTAH